MHRFEIWAPRGKSMAVSFQGAALPMNGPNDHGWWWLEVSEASAGMDYGYLIDDDKIVYADPRSLRQPKGVLGRSRIYDENEFRWTDHGSQAPPLWSAVIYE